MNKLLVMILLWMCIFGSSSQMDIGHADDYKCSLPDVTSVHVDLDVHRFRSDFAKVSEVKFPGLIGPLNERLICKIKCVDGNWVGPLCSPTQNGRFQPILRQCAVLLHNPNLTIYYKSKPLLNETALPHASILLARCTEFGIYKFSGDNELRCNNGAWSGKMPTCVPTSALTNHTGDAPPTILHFVEAGSALVDEKGHLLIFPGSTVRLACLWPRDGTQHTPEWNWSNTVKNNVGWSTKEGENKLHYCLSLNHVTQHHNGIYTCTTPAGTTNTANVKVVNIVCPPRNFTSDHMRAFSQGTRLGSTISFSCQQGYRLKGAPVVSCRADGRWFPEEPICLPVACPELRDPAPQVVLLEYNASLGGRAIFTCVWGYRLIGQPGLECESDGRWSHAVPTCIPIYCPEPPEVKDMGKRLAVDTSPNKKHQVGELLVYHCSPGYQIVGESSIVCTESGFWSHPPPFCMKPSEVLKADTIFVDNTTFVNFNE